MDKRTQASTEFLNRPESQQIFEDHTLYLQENPIIITSTQDAIEAVKEFFPGFDDSDVDRIKKNATIQFLRKSEYKDTVEMMCRRLWLLQSIKIFDHLYSTGLLQRELSTGLQFEEAETKAHMEFLPQIIKRVSGRYNIIQYKKKQYEIATKYGEEVDLYRD